MAKRNLAQEELIERGVMDERDIDYFDHLQVPLVEMDDVALEGIFKAVVHGIGSRITDDYRHWKGMFLEMESKRKYIVELLDDLSDWLKEEERDNPNLDLNMGAIKTWLKSSETFVWRYYFLIEDSTWESLVKDVKSEVAGDLETFTNFDFKNRTKAANYMDSISDIKGLLKVVELYKKRTNIFFDLASKRKRSLRKTPFQVILAGALDLRRTVKKIVNLAV
jgi:hypothetical protein